MGLMSRQASTMLGDAEYEHVSKALSKVGATMYEFVKEAVLRHADFVLSIREAPIVPEMVEALRNRKWTLYQNQDFSDRNHIAWLKTRFPTAMDRQIQEALMIFLTKHKQAKP